MSDRERFEEWFDKQYASLDAEDEDLAWDAWQAAIACATEEAEQRGAEKRLDECYDYVENYIGTDAADSMVEFVLGNDKPDHHAHGHWCGEAGYDAAKDKPCPACTDHHAHGHTTEGEG